MRTLSERYMPFLDHAQLTRTTDTRSQERVSAYISGQTIGYPNLIRYI